MCTDKYCTVFRMGQSGGTAGICVFCTKTQIPKLSANTGNLCRNALQICHLCFGLTLTW